MKALKNVQQSNSALFYSSFETDFLQYLELIHLPLQELGDDPMKSKWFAIIDAITHIVDGIQGETFTKDSLKTIMETLKQCLETIAIAEAEFISKQPSRLLFGERGVFDCIQHLGPKLSPELIGQYHTQLAPLLKPETEHAEALAIRTIALLHTQLGDGLKPPI